MLGKSGILKKQIEAIGISNQRETTVLWDRSTGKPVTPAIVWQDSRTAVRCDDLKKNGYTDLFKDKTGLVLDPYFSGTKLEWLLRNREIQKLSEEGKLAFGTVDSWLIWNLTAGKSHITDHTNASRTLLYNIHTFSWDTQLLEILNIPESVLPGIKDSSGLLALTNSSVLGEEIPIMGVAGDQQAALFGQLCFHPGMVKNTYGTGCFIVMNTGSTPVASKSGLLTTIGWKYGNELCYALEGSVFLAGALISWLRDELKIIKNINEIEELAGTVEDSGGVTVIPAHTGLGTPYWDQHARGAIMGLSRGSHRGHVARASMEAIALRTLDVIGIMKNESQLEVKQLRVDGGASMNNLLMAIQANLLKSSILRPVETESTGLGAAFLAGLGTGYWKNKEEIKGIWKVDKVFEPDLYTDCSTIIENWQKGIEAVKGWTK